MKKYVLKATALAIGALVGGSAVAAVIADVDLADAATASKFAKELSYASDANSINHASKLSLTTKLGFGVAANTTRYIRLDFTNAKLDENLGSAIGTDIDVGSITAGQSSVAIAAGGNAGDDFVVFAVGLGGTDTSQSATAAVNVKIPGIRVTSTAAPVTVKYSLHETGTSASTAGGNGNAVLGSPVTGTLATFASGLKLAVDTTVGNSTASVQSSFKKFLAGGGATSVDNSLAGGADLYGAKLGSITYDRDNTVLGRDGAPVTLAALVANGTKAVVTGDFSAVDGADAAAKKTNVFIAAANDCTTKAASLPATDVTATAASFTVDEAAIAGRSLCYWTNGTSEIKASTYKVRVDVTSDTNATSQNLADTSLASIVRDGTELYAPFATVYGSGTTNGNRIVLTSTHNSDAAVEAQVISEAGTTCTGTPASFNLPAGKQLFIDTSAICPTITTGKTRFAVKLIIAAPNSTISGVYNSYTFDPATSKVTDLTSYPLQRAATN